MKPELQLGFKLARLEATRTSLSYNGEPSRPRLWSGPGWSPAQTKAFIEDSRDWNVSEDIPTTRIQVQI